MRVTSRLKCVQVEAEVIEVECQILCALSVGSKVRGEMVERKEGCKAVKHIAQSEKHF